MLLPDAESFERKKWELADTAGLSPVRLRGALLPHVRHSAPSGDTADALTLQGWRRIAGMAVVEGMLKSLHLAHSAEALEAWSLGLNLSFTRRRAWP